MFAIAVSLCAALMATAAPEAVANSLPPVRYEAPTLDAEKGEVARSVAARLQPPGWTATWFKGSMGLANIVHTQLMMPVERFARERGATLPEEGRDGPPVVRLRLLAIIDPASLQRLSMISPIVEKTVADIAASREAQLREAIAVAYAQRMSVAELRALDRFLATPEGTAFAGVNRAVSNDWGVFAAQQTIARAIEDADPVITRRISNSTSKLPKIKGWNDLSEAERKEVSKLLNIDQSGSGNERP